MTPDVAPAINPAIILERFAAIRAIVTGIGLRLCRACRQLKQIQ